MPTTNPVLPVSDAVLLTAPPFIPVEDAWADPEWCAAAAKSPGERTEQETYLFFGGVRPHPWGNAAYRGQLPNGQEAWFPHKAAYDEYMGHQTEQAAQPALDALNRGLAAHAQDAA